MATLHSNSERQPVEKRRTGAVSALEDPPALVPETVRFADRRDAGNRLATLLARLREQDSIVVAIPRGGVPVAAEVARALHAPLEVTVVRKVGAPSNPEFAIGAVAEGGVRVLSEQSVRAAGVSASELRTLVGRAEAELAERLECYRGGRGPASVAGRTVILVDDGLATGRSALAAIRSLRARGAGRVVLAVPVAALDSVRALSGEADEIVCVETPADFWAVGFWYEDFAPTSDEEVATLLADAASSDDVASDPSAPGSTGEPSRLEDLTLPVGSELELSGDLTLPCGARAIVLFAHGSGSSRKSPRNRAVAEALNEAGIATLLFDLLTPSEELDRANVFDIELLSARLVAVSEWVARQGNLRSLALGYFGASTGAAAALSAAAQLGDRVGAVVSRGGRPDLARGLGSVSAPTLLIVGGADTAVLELNRAAQRELRCRSELAIVPGATHLFEEQGALEHVARRAIEWFELWLVTRAR